MNLEKLKAGELKVSNSNWKAFVSIILITFIASIPLLNGYLTEGHDLTFHLNRIIGLAEGIRAGNFPVKIQPHWLNGHGYPCSVFYGDVLLYIPAFLYLLGMGIQSSYVIFVILINFATAGSSYLCFFRISGNNFGGAFWAPLCTL